MEKHGIGTDASVATHINNICERNYVKIGPSRKLIPTELGVSLVHGYNKIDPELAAPELRSNIEKSVDMIAKVTIKLNIIYLRIKGQANYDDVLKKIIEIFRKKFLHFRENISLMDQLFGGNFGTFEDAICINSYNFLIKYINKAKGRPYTKCGKCKRFMKLIEESNKLHCEQCKITFDLPTVTNFIFYDTYNDHIVEWNIETCWR